MLNNFACVAKQVIVQKQFTHLTLEERSHSVLEVGWIFVLDEDVQFVAAVFGEVPIFLCYRKL